jgi:hypothetical protein
VVQVLTYLIWRVAAVAAALYPVVVAEVGQVGVEMAVLAVPAVLVVPAEMLLPVVLAEPVGRVIRVL